MQKETSLKSQKETQQPNQQAEPKYALEEKYKEQSEKLPIPTGWRLIVLPFKMGDKTKGGVLMTESTLERQQIGSQCGLVLAMGSQCYNDKERYPDGPWCKVND